jgi:hypothetical protein
MWPLLLLLVIVPSNSLEQQPALLLKSTSGDRQQCSSEGVVDTQCRSGLNDAMASARVTAATASHKCHV